MNTIKFKGANYFCTQNIYSLFLYPIFRWKYFKNNAHTDLFLNTLRNEKLSGLGFNPVGEFGVDEHGNWLLVTPECSFEVSPTEKENMDEFDDDPFPGGLPGLFVGKSGGMEFRPIKLFNILEQAALITPNFRDLKSLTTVLDDPNEVYPFCIFDLRLELE